MQASGGCEVGYRDCATRVAELLRFHFGATAAAATTLADDEADRIFTIAGANKVLGFVADALPSDRFAARLAGYKAKILYKSNALLLECVRLSSLLDSANIPHVHVKGPIEQYEIYGDFFVRPSSDMDILVSKHEFARCRQRIVEDGYEILSPSIWWTAALGEQALVKAGRPRLTIDLHYRLDQPGLPRPRAEASFLSQARRIACRGAMVPVLSPPDAMLLDVMSFGKALFNREPSGGYMADLYARLMPDLPKAVSSLLTMAAERGLEGVARVALAGLAAIFGAGFGSEAQPRGSIVQVPESKWREMILTPWAVGAAWPRRRDLLWAYCEADPVRYGREFSRLAASEILRRMVERGPRRDLLGEP